MKIAKNKVCNIQFTKIFDSKVSFDKTELGKILNIYGKMVALGEWRGSADSDRRGPTDNIAQQMSRPQKYHPMARFAR